LRKQNNKGEEVGGIVPHITLKSIANSEPPDYEVLVDRPEQVKSITRVTGRFVVEATIPTPQRLNDDTPQSESVPTAEDDFTARMIGILRASPLLHVGGGRSVKLASIREPAQALTLSAEAVALSDSLADEMRATRIANGELALTGDLAVNEPSGAGGKPVAILFGPENGALTETTVRAAHDEASMKSRGYAHLYVIGFAIDPRAREYLEHAAQLGIAATYVQATPDVLMGDLLKNMRSSQIFSVCGLPDVSLDRVAAPEDAAPAAKDFPYFAATLHGLDVFDPSTQEVDHRSGLDVPCWLLDTDYNGMVFHVNQAFFPRTSAWDNLKRSLKAEFDESVWTHLSGNTSAPFTIGRHGKIAVKVIDDRGNELMVVKEVKP
jgi:adenine-specific DNA-methyltransferase